MALYNTISSRLRDRRTLGDQIADLSRGTADLARQVGEIARRLERRRSQRRARPVDARAARSIRSPPRSANWAALVRQIADTVAAHDAALQKQSALPAHDRAGRRSAAAPRRAAARRARRRSPCAGSPSGLAREGIAELIARRSTDNRIDLYLQPIVTLPQRKVRFYEALSRLRTEDGEIVAGRRLHRRTPKPSA